MKTKHLGLVVLLAVMLLSGCQKTKPDNDLVRLLDWMQGSFSSQAQSLENKAYFDIRLNMVKIWPQRSDGHWLYVEQAAANYLDKPYRQRIYHVYKHPEKPSHYASAVYEMPDAMSFAGAYANPEAFNAITAEDLIERIGCTVYLDVQADGSFSGSTPGKECLSSLRGASYATSIVRIDDAGIESWDQGFNSEDEQVWGAIEGPYVFMRQ